MDRVKIFLFMCLLGGTGGALGSMGGNAFGRGGVFVGGFLGGAMLVIGAGYLSARWHWIRPSQRMWVIMGALLGFAMAAVVTLSTLSSPLGPMLSTTLIGSGAVLGSLVGQSAHEET